MILHYIWLFFFLVFFRKPLRYSYDILYKFSPSDFILIKQIVIFGINYYRRFGRFGRNPPS